LLSVAGRLSGYTCTTEVLAASRLTSHRTMPSAVFATCKEGVNDAWSTTVIQVLDYYRYGSTRINQTIGGFNEGKQFIAQYTDPETNFSYLRAR